MRALRCNDLRIQSGDDLLLLRLHVNDVAAHVAIMEGENLPTRTYNHVAFKISEADYPACLERVMSLGLDVREGRSRVDGEGRSIYFHDDDNHLFELHTGTLAERLKHYAMGKS